VARVCISNIKAPLGTRGEKRNQEPENPTQQHKNNPIKNGHRKHRNWPGLCQTPRPTLSAREIRRNKGMSRARGGKRRGGIAKKGGLTGVECDAIKMHHE